MASLIDQLEGWLREADEDHALTIDRIPITIAERRYGTYEVEGLRVRMGVEEFRVEPVALDILGPLLGDGLDTEIKDGWVKISSGFEKEPALPPQGRARRRVVHRGQPYLQAPASRSILFEDAVLQLLK